MENPGRKFWLALVSAVGCHWALWARLIDGDAYKAVMLGVVAVYVAGNVTQKALAKEGGGA